MIGAEVEEVAAVEPAPIRPAPSTSRATLSATTTTTVNHAARTIQTTSQQTGTVPKVEIAGGGQEEEEEGDVEMNEEREVDEAHEDDEITRLNVPQPSVGPRGRGRSRKG